MVAHFGWEERTGNGKYDHIAMKNLSGFKNSVASNKGYYIGRFEAGKEGSSLVVKRDVNVWNKVTQYDAVKFSRAMYNTNVESDLVNSYAWDTALVFIREFSGDDKYPIRTSSDSVNRTKFKTGHGFMETGDVKCNIFDMRLNYEEWTTEACWCCSSPSVYRGGANRMDNTLNYSAFSRSNYSSWQNSDWLSFRVVVYLPAS